MPRETYTVKSGDSLSIIARDIIGDIDRWTELAYINSIAYPYVIQPGQTILLPSDDPLQVTVTRGTGQAAPVLEAALSFNPATVTLLVAGAALILFWDDIFGTN